MNWKEIDSKMLCWLAGIWEGEGCFYYTRHYNRVAASISMTDEDIIQNIACLLKTSYRSIAPKKSKHKINYKITLYSSKAIGLMLTLYSLLGQRRQNKIKEILANYKPDSRFRFKETDILKAKQMVIKGKSQQEVANLLGCTQSAISRLLSGDR